MNKIIDGGPIVQNKRQQTSIKKEERLGCLGMTVKPLEAKTIELKWVIKSQGSQFLHISEFENKM